MDPKRFSTLQARAAIAGYSLTAQRKDADSWSFALSSFDTTTTEYDSLDAVEAWLTNNAGREAVDA
jgi:hypothetical protein